MAELFQPACAFGMPGRGERQCQIEDLRIFARIDRKAVIEVAQLEGAARLQFVQALNRVFGAGAVMSAIGLFATFFLPPVDFSKGVPEGAGEQMLAAEMASLEPESEPESVSSPSA